MKKELTILFFLLVCCFAGAQTQNVLLDRSFWKTNPDLHTVQQKIMEGNDATQFNANAFDATVYALLEKADDAVIEYLLSLDGNTIHKKTHDSRTYLHWAAYAGKTQVVEKLLKDGASVSALDSHGNTPLTFAANSGQMDTAVYDTFIKYGVNLSEEVNEDGANALLLLAPYITKEETFSYFTDHNLDLHSVDDNGNGIFNYAAKKGNINVLKLLVEKGVDYKSLNNLGGNAFLFAAQGTRGHSNSLEVYKYLGELGLDPNIVTKQGNTPLHRIAYNVKEPEIFDFFLKAGADVNLADADGNTAFLNAASRNTPEIVSLLAENVKDYNYRNHDGQTALMLAVRDNNIDVVSFLLKKGSRVLEKDNNGNSLATYLLASFNERNTSEFEAKRKLLQAKGLQLNTIQAEGNTLYHLAAKENSLQLFKLLEGLDISLNKKNDEGLTPLHIAAMKATDDAIMKYLVSKGADIAIRTDFEESVLDLAKENEILQQQNVQLNFLK